jgi:hypothetical protein
MMNTSSASRIVSTVANWAGIRTDELPPGGMDFLLGQREIGHVHGDELVDIPFPKKLRDELVAAGRAEPHRVLPKSGWVSVPLNNGEDIDHAIELLKMSYDLALNN